MYTYSNLDKNQSPMQNRVERTKESKIKVLPEAASLIQKWEYITFVLPAEFASITVNQMKLITFSYQRWKETVPMSHQYDQKL